MSVCCECCMSSGRGMCDGQVPRPEEPYRDRERERGGIVCLYLCVRACVCVSLTVIGCNNNPLHIQ